MSTCETCAYFIHARGAHYSTVLYPDPPELPSDLRVFCCFIVPAIFWSSEYDVSRCMPPTKQASTLAWTKAATAFTHTKLPDPIEVQSFINMCLVSRNGHQSSGHLGKRAFESSEICNEKPARRDVSHIMNNNLPTSKSAAVGCTISRSQRVIILGRHSHVCSSAD